MRKTGIGIIGCGNIAKYGNAPGYLMCDKAEIVAVCDSFEERAKEAKNLWGAKKYYTDYRKLIKDDQVDAVDICLPHHLHAKVAVEAAENSRHIAVQKPIAMNIIECDEMIKAARRANVKLMLEECEIFYPPYRKAKELVDSNEIGETKLIQISLQSGDISPIDKERRTGRNQAEKIPEDLLWRRVREKHGGFLFDAGWHKFAFIFHLFGPVKQTSAWMDNAETEMPCTIMWKHEDNRYGSMSVVRAPHMYAHYEPLRAPLPATVEIIGSRGIIWATRCEGQTLRTAPTIIYQGEYPGKTTRFENVEAEYFSGFRNMTAHFVNCIQNNQTPILTGEEGKKVLQFVLSVYKSAKEGKPIVPSSIKDWKWEDFKIS